MSSSVHSSENVRSGEEREHPIPSSGESSTVKDIGEDVLGRLEACSLRYTDREPNCRGICQFHTEIS